MKKMNYVLVAALFLIFGCASTFQSMPGAPGYINESTSKFDKSRSISMEPAMLESGDILFGLYKNDKMPKDEIVLIAVVRGAKSIARGESLHFNIDGQFISFKSIDTLTDIKFDPGVYGKGIYFPPRNWSSKRYVTDLSFIKKLIDAKEALVKIDLEKTYIEDNFSYDFPTCARPGFREVYNRVASW